MDPVPDPGSILHVGDDWAADVVGAKQAGWLAAWLAARPADSPLPGSARDDTVHADLELVRLEDLESALDRWPTDAPRPTTVP
jgi:FMN phosphatase YigB (HAD superfamily)